MSNTDKLQEIKEKYLSNNFKLQTYSGSEIYWLITQLEQTQKERDELFNHNLKLSHDLDTDSNIEQVKIFNERIEEFEAKLEKAQAENEQLKADKQKLVEVLTWYTKYGYEAYDDDCGEKASKILSEVKGNGPS